jgi:hypothetical protein
VRELPNIVTIEQEFPRPKVHSIENTILDEFQTHPEALPDLHERRIAVAVGSRGISNIGMIVKSVVKGLQDRGAQPFIVPAMGSHGGGTPEGQQRILENYGVSERLVGAPVAATVETVELGTSRDGVPILVDKAAFDSDGIVLINRIKPHTDFRGAVGSGLMKMIAVGLGNVTGARSFHSWVRRLGQEKLIEARARALLDTEKVVCGIAILENAYHETAHLELLPARTLVTREKELLAKAKDLMPSLPTENLDILVIDQVGKNISGTGMDPNITGRWFRSSATWQETPNIQRIVVMSLTKESGGNAIGIGMADFCTDKVVSQMDTSITYLNVLTSQNVIAARLPIHFATARETILRAMMSLGTDCNAENVRLIRILDTLNLTKLEVSEGLIEELRAHPRITKVSPLREMQFEPDGSLEPLI